MRGCGDEAPSPRKHRVSGAGQFLRFYNEINAFLAYMGLYSISALKHILTIAEKIK